MQTAKRDGTREILREAQRRVPAGQRFVQEAFTSEHHRPVLVKLNDLRPDTFYILDEMTVCALCDTVIEWCARHGGGQLTVSYSAYGEWQAQQKRMRHLAGRFTGVRVLAVGGRGGDGQGFDVRDTAGNALARFRLVLREGKQPLAFICREKPGRTTDPSRYLGFYTCDAETVDEVADDLNSVARGLTRRLATFERLQVLHQTTQRVTRELESYSRRMELAIRRAQRRPDLLTPARFDRIVRQSIAKIEQLKEIPRRALRTLGSNQW
jgi:hypothetical protein